MKKLLLLITALFLLVSVDGQILRYSNYTAPGGGDEDAFPQILSGTAVSDTNDYNKTSQYITMPTGVEEGDLILVFVSIDDAATVSIGDGIGWTIESQTSYSTNITGAVVWKIATETNLLTLTTSTAQASMAQAYRISDFYADNPLTVTYATGAADRYPDPPANTGEYGADDYLWFTIACGDAYDSYATSAPADFSDLIVTYAALGGTSSLSVANREYNTGDEYNPGTFTMYSATGDQWVTFTVIVNPAQ